MKYIRTKYEILDTSKEKLDIYSDKSKVIRTFDFLIGDREAKKIYDVISYSDSIKDLCDEYVIDNCVCYKKDWEKKTEELKKYILETRIVYGAIWTDKGLIYVAKMNEKGELELI